MKIDTTRFGEVEVEDDQIISMPEGIIGFEECRKFALLDHSPDSPFKWFQSVDDPGLAFVIIDPFPFVSDYKVDLKEADLEFLGAKDAADVLILTFVSIKRESSSITANLMGPVIINLTNLIAKQLILSDTSYSPSHRIMQPESVPSSHIH